MEGKSTSLNKKDKEYWIAGAIEKEGSLTDYLKRNRKKLKRRYKMDPFNQDGTISVSVLHKMIADDRLTLTTRRRAQLALNLRQARRK